MSPKNRTVEPPSAQIGSSRPTPKDLGCFQCSRRRIICDKTEPSCGKCIKKGIDCSGVNRIRFTGGVARRGKLKDCKIPDVSSNGVAHLPTTTAFPEVRWTDEKKRVAKRKREVKKKVVIQDQTQTRQSTRICDDVDGTSNPPLIVVSEQPCTPSAVADSVLQPSPSQEGTSEPEEFVEEITRTENDMLQLYMTYNSVHPWIAPLSAEARMLFSYFSEAVAPVMVVLDTASNGYRELVLPMALEDEVLRRAVGVVAAQHLSRQRPEMRDAAEAGRAAVISRLRRDSLSATQDQVFNKFTWATLIVLLVGETVTGSSDYSFLVQMLLCLSANSRTADINSAATKFLQVQTNMFELLGLPLLGEDTGVLAIKKSFESWQDWLTCEQFSVGSESHRILDQIRLCFAAACTIYIRRATSKNIGSASTAISQGRDLQNSTIQDLIGRISQIPPHTPGAHALVWPCFVAGAEASDPDQRAFFVTYMNSIYARTKFRNIPMAVQSLENLWSNKGERRWTQCLSELSNVLVM